MSEDKIQETIEQVSFIVEHYDNDKLAETNEKLALMVARLTRENDRLKELIVGAYKTMDAWQLTIANGSDTWGYGKGCLEQLDKLRDDMRELGVEVDG